ncbi:MAG: MBL fold metallo-hydrolase [Coriobacteriales bacterium]|nr:MBL fold metallo-hydrolase [Coriobacteriales bacterium]
MAYFVYLLRCEGGELYAGITTNLERRFEEHASGGPKGAKYTRTHPPLRFEATWEMPDRASASALEFRLKRLSHTRKEAIVQDPTQAHDLVEESFGKKSRADKSEGLPPRLRLHVLASGSKGNCSLVEDIETGSLTMVDCGITKKAFLERCANCKIDPTRVEAILITHEHSDHTKGLGVVTRGLAKLGASPTLYVSEAVHRASSPIRSIEDALDLRHFASGDDLRIGNVAVHAFPTLHDAAESFGFRFACDSDVVGFMTDTGIVTGEALESLQACRLLAIEANHDRKMLANGPYPYYLKQRVGGDHGHLSNDQSSDLLESLLCNELEQVVAMHVSQNNNTYRLPRESLAQALEQHDHPAEAFVAYQDKAISL